MVGEAGIKDDTIIVFMNDNGSSRGDKIYNAGMRGKKGSGYEGGHRGICFVRWPNGGWAPRTVDNLSHITDILPTFADLLEFDVPQTVDPFDGIIENDSLEIWIHSMIIGK